MMRELTTLTALVTRTVKRITPTALLAGTLAVSLLGAVPAQADGLQSMILGPAFNYHLLGTPLVAGGGPAPINPGVLVGLNPQPLPPFPDPGTSMDLTNPGGPVYTYPGIAGIQQQFIVEFGMNAGGNVSFTTPTPTPGDPLQQTFTGMAPGGEIYTITFNIGGGDPGSFVSLNPQPLPPFPDPNFGFEIFSFMAGQGDPTLTFSVTSNGTQFGFAPVPEPGSMILLGSGLFGLAGTIRRKLMR